MKKILSFLFITSVLVSAPTTLAREDEVRREDRPDRPSIEMREELKDKREDLKDSRKVTKDEFKAQKDLMKEERKDVKDQIKSNREETKEKIKRLNKIKINF